MRPVEFDAIVVGAGFAGIYMLQRLRALGLKTKVIEAGTGPGGTWYWNRYPGLRCDVESMTYSYSFSDEIQREWTWSERYATQAEILSYINYVVDKLDLRRDMKFETRVTDANFDELTNRWHIETDGRELFAARFCIMATGCLSVPDPPKFKGLERFEGKWYHTGDWPKEGVDFAGERFGVIGTGSSGIQLIPVIAEQAAHLPVFQRTANYSIPAWNKPLDEEAIVSAAHKTGKGVTAEDHTIIGGLGGAVAEVLGEQRPTPMKRVGIRDTFGESAANEDLLAKYGLTSDHVAQAARALLA